MRSSWSRQVWEWSLPDGAMLKIEFESKVYDAFQGREICNGTDVTQCFQLVPFSSKMFKNDTIAHVYLDAGSDYQCCNELKGEVVVDDLVSSYFLVAFLDQAYDATVIGDAEFVVVVAVVDVTKA